MKLKLKYFFLFFIVAVTGSGNIGKLYAYHDYYAKGSVMYLFGDNANIRKNPGIEKSRIVDTLPIGTPVVVVQKTDIKTVIDGYSENWYLIKYKKNNGHSTGYIWGGLFANAKSATGGKLFLVGIKKYNSEQGYTAECRLIIGNKLVSSVEFQPHYLPEGASEGFYEYSVSAELRGPSGLDGIEKVIKIYFNYEACGYPYGNVWIGYNKNKLYYIGKDTSVSEGGVFHSDEKLLFPDKNTKGKNRILFLRENSDFDEKINDYKLTEKKESLFLWKDYKLIPAE